jgi:hypothetical protein
MFRVVVELRILSQDPSQHTISVTQIEGSDRAERTHAGRLEDLHEN